MLRRGRKSAAQTPAPKSERIYGSKKNKKGSAASKKSGSTIKLNDKIVKSLTEKAREYNENHSSKVTVPTLKAVYRRGLGAYSSSHRPTITGGVPNSRNAWAMARVNKFLLKKSGKKVKAAYVQDDDLMAKGGKVFNDKELLAKYKRGESIGFTGIAHLKAKGLIERADGTKRKSYGRGGKFKATGDCYYIAGQFAMNNLFTPKKIDYIGTPYLVHAEVQGQGRLENIRYGHAWIEDDIFVYDFSNNRELKIPKDFYYSLGNVDTTNPLKYRKYTFEEARRKMVDTGNYGCWDLEVEYANGGEVDNYIFCENCGWNWKESETTEDDKYICHKCQHDNETSYIMSKLKKPKTITELSGIHNVPEQELESQLQKGIKTEMEHTTDKKIAETIALHHIEEIPDYYDKLQEMENPIVKLYSKSTKELKDGGVVVGKRHSESDENGSGEKFLVKSTGQVVELEGGEGVLCKNSMESDRKFTFENRTMTGREIASFLNHKYGGVEFAKGGEVNHVCGCKMFYHGGELPSATVEELEGGEAVITVKTMESKDKYNFNGTKMTPRKILSQINGLSGGKKFDEGGIIDLRKHKMENEKTLTKMVYFTEKILYSK